MKQSLYKSVVVAATTLFISACHSDNPNDPPLSVVDITTIEITAPITNIKKSENVQLAAKGGSGSGQVVELTGEVEWLSTDPDSISIDDNGVASGLQTGSATITASINGIVSNEISLTVLPAQLSEIQILPSYLSLIQGKQRQLSALGLYDDGTTADISASAEWQSDNEATATVSESGLLTALSEGLASINVSVDGIVSTPTTVKVCQLKDECISVLDQEGKRFSSSPSEPLMTSLGYSQYDGTITETGVDGPDGEFATFTHDNAVAWCRFLASQQYENRSNWRLASRNELLQELYGEYGSMYSAEGWPASRVYWSNTADGSMYYNVALNDGFSISDFPTRSVYASCVSIAE